MNLTIALLPGDGIGPEISRQGVKAANAVAAKFGHRLHFRHALIGAAAIDATGDPFP